MTMINMTDLLSMAINLDIEPASRTTACALTRARVPLRFPLEEHTVKSYSCLGVSEPTAAGTLDDVFENKMELPLFLGRLLQNAYNSGRIPHAKLLQVMDLVPSERLQYNHFSQQDIISNQTHDLPFRLIWTDDRTCLARNKDDKEFIGLLNEAEGIVEGDTWTMPVEGDRWTRDLLDSSFLSTTRLSQPQYETCKKLLDCCESKFPKWARNGWESAKDCHVVTTPSTKSSQHLYCKGPNQQIARLVAMTCLRKLHLLLKFVLYMLLGWRSD